MYRNLNSSNSQLDKVMTNEQFNQIVDAIISGKYSWACLLILRFAGYNPLHYIPYRTYNRLMKSNRDKLQSVCATANGRQAKSASYPTSQKSTQKLRDLSYLEEVERSAKVKGGMRGFVAGIIPDFIWSRAKNS
jgi:hypothetical protein